MKSPKLHLFLLLFLATSPAKSENTGQGGYPIYNHKDGTLTIPRVDTSDQVGRYQNVVFQLDTQLDVWILKKHQFRDSNATDLQVSVFPYVRSGYFSIPDQLEVQITGDITCSRIGQINQRRTGNHFEIQITEDPLQPGEVCDQVARPFKRTIQLDVFRLQAGEYHYTLNGTIFITAPGFSTGDEFILPFDTISTECGGNPEVFVDCSAIFFDVIRTYI